METLLESLGKLLAVFKDPVNVVLLLVAFLEGFALYKIVAFGMANWKESIANDLRNAQALEGVLRVLERLERVVANGKP